MFHPSSISLPSIHSKDHSFRQRVEIRDSRSISFRNDFLESVNASQVGDDFSSLLTCTYLSGTWECLLSNFQGKSVEKILGRYATESTIPLSLLIPEDKREHHQVMLNSILNEGSKSNYWNLLFNNMLKDRYIQIINLSDFTVSNVKIVMELKSYGKDNYEFLIKFNDNSLSYDTAHRAGVLTHNFRSIFRAILNQKEEMEICLSKITVNNNPTEHEILFKKFETALDNLGELANEGLKTCQPTFKDLIQEEDSSLNIKVDFVDDVIKAYLPQIKLMFASLEEKHVQILFQPNASSVLLELFKINLLKEFIQNLIKNSIAADANQIIISTNAQDNNFICHIKDNGRGIDDKKRELFFKRDLKKESHPAKGLIEESRGEGTLLSYYGWRRAGGLAIVDSSPSSQSSGASFQLTIPAAMPVLFESHNILKRSDYQSKPILLLIDDSLMQLKLILKRISPTLSLECFKDLKLTWGDKNFVSLESEDWYIICAGGYLSGLQCAKEFSADVIISDHQLSHSFYDGASLLKRIYDHFEYHPQLCLHTSIKESSADQLEIFDYLKSIGINFFVKGEPDTLNKIFDFLESFLYKKKIECGISPKK